MSGYAIHVKASAARDIAALPRHSPLRPRASIPRAVLFFILLFLGIHPADIPVQIDQTDITRGSVAYTQ